MEVIEKNKKQKKKQKKDKNNYHLQLPSSRLRKIGFQMQI